MSVVSIFEIKDAKKNNIFIFLKGSFFVMRGPMDMILACFQRPM